MISKRYWDGLNIYELKSVKSLSDCGSRSQYTNVKQLSKSSKSNSIIKNKKSGIIKMSDFFYKNYFAFTQQ